MGSIIGGRCGHEYGVLGKQLWRRCKPGVAISEWTVWGGVQVMAWEIGNGGCGWLGRKTLGVINCCKVSCVQKFPFAILVMLIAMSMLATHT